MNSMRETSLKMALGFYSNIQVPDSVILETAQKFLDYLIEG